ncbi:unnamed protein product [Protopolystoma xenopodis]|uniref:Alpha-D-phosphohexomutase alpha/beta/alpha domain-containing protein n=1 Tax=Protopolystoma xenopodis TaxID=117903 RepID=A0A3S5FBV8_9PLAT|nr:unnamed protein product [Protopolystoma xenopodis]
MDAGLCSLCGEESFGTGSNHIREKDGLWALLAWLSILSVRRSHDLKTAEVEVLMREHWSRFGRHFFTRYDFEDCESTHGNEIMRRLDALLADPKTVGRSYSIDGIDYSISKIDNYTYTDPVDKTVSKNQHKILQY